MTKTVLHIDASVRLNGSTTRALSDAVVQRLREKGGISDVVRRDLSAGLPLIDETWVGANFTPEADRSPEQIDALTLSETLIGEIEAADILVIGLPIYNFGVPAGMKAWIDLVARARRTFRYTENGPEGLLTGKKAIIVAASGGTAVGSEIDFATSWMRHVLGFIGITDVELVAADRQMARGGEAEAEARQALD
ncbi:MAG: NAD(P)H-dependent oxidoreductase, partial [Pseudomonadota bacterium]